MNETLKKYLRPALVLGLIAAASGGVIATLNVFTAPAIAQNQKEAILRGYKELYPELETVSEEKKLEGYVYTRSVVTAFDKEGTALGNIYGSLGVLPNGYGNINMLIAVMGEKDAPILGKITVVSTTSTYKNITQEKYVDVYNSTLDEKSLDNVKIGATFSASLIKEMANEAKSAYRKEAM